MVNIGETKNPDLKFVILTNTDFWDDPPRIRHQVAESLAKKYKVYFVSANYKGFPKLKTNSINENLTVLIPHFFIDYRIRYRISFLNLLYQNWLFKLLKKKLGNNNIVINFDNTATSLHYYFNNSVYYCNDYNIRYYYIKCIKDYLEKCESKVASNSKICFATSKFLVDRLKIFNNTVIELRHGAPIVNEKLIFKRNSTVKVGLVGFLGSKRLSIEIIKKLASKPNTEIYLYGLIDNFFKDSLKNIYNIKFKGVLKGSELIHDLKKVDVGIAPYRIEDVNPGGTPNKLWLYLSVGKPVVITDLPSIADWNFNDKFVYRAKNDCDFIDKVYKAYREDTEELMFARSQFAKNNSWDRRTDKLVNDIKKIISQSW